MRKPRIKEPGEACYHVISRIVDRRMLLDDEEKERFRKTMRAVEGFSGCVVLNYAILDNHFHLVLKVPETRPIGDQELIERVGCLYPGQVVKQLAEALQAYRQAGQDQAVEALKAHYTYRMHDLSEFGKTLKQRVTQSYNRRHGRKGTLWEERFKSPIVQGRGHPLATLSAYIDLNAVRAGIVEDPRDYRFCGYGEALGGSRQARAGLCAIMASLGASGTWRETAAAYARYLYQQGEERGVAASGCSRRPGISRERVARVLAQGGELTRWEMLNCRVRYFTDGAVLGSRAFVNAVFQRHRSCFGAGRESGARPMRGSAWGDLCTARRLRLEVIRPPA